VARQALLDAKMQRKIGEKYRSLCPWDSIGEWYIPLNPGQLKPRVTVLMADTKDQPLLLAAPLGRGRIILSAVPIYGLGGLIRDEISRVVISPACGEKAGVLTTILREDRAGGRYLGLINTDAREALATRVVLAGIYRRITDLGVGDSFPVPVQVEGESTRIPVRLAPGEGTILRLER